MLGLRNSEGLCESKTEVTRVSTHHLYIILVFIVYNLSYSYLHSIFPETLKSPLYLKRLTPSFLRSVQQIFKRNYSRVVNTIHKLSFFKRYRL